jgi:DNA-binding Xre family transcriptional regulator
MVAIKLREAMQHYKRRTGKKMTYRILAEISGVAEPTLHSIGSRTDYNATLSTIERLCLALDVGLQDMLELIPEPPKPKRGPRRTG